MAANPERDRRAVDVSPLAQQIFEDVLASQNQKGLRKYRTPLHTFNGRDALWDAIEETIDHFRYLVQAWHERTVLDQEMRQLKANNAALLQQATLTPRAGNVGPAPEEPISKSWTTDGTRITHINGEPLRPLIHRYGPHPCHKPAMFLTRLVRRGEPPDPSILRVMPDMHVPLPNEAPLCGSCGRPVDPYTNADLDWTEHFTPESLQTVRRPLRPVPPTPPSPDVSDGLVGEPTDVEAYPSALRREASAQADSDDEGAWDTPDRTDEMLDGLTEIARALYDPPPTPAIPLHPGEVPSDGTPVS